MGRDTAIEWCDHSINFWWGCEKVSPGCAHCYAEALAKRFGHDIWGASSPRLCIWGAASEAHKLNAKAQRLGVRYRVFTNSMADFFEEDHGQPIVHGGKSGMNRTYVYPDGCPTKDSCENRPCTLTHLRNYAFRVIDETHSLDWIIVTKRPENIRNMWPAASRYPDPSPMARGPQSTRPDYTRNNVWLLATVENQEQAYKRVPELLKCRDLSPVLGLSMEPLLGPVDIIPYLGGKSFQCSCGFHATESELAYTGGDRWSCVECGEMCSIGGTLDWIIVGGESGPHARLMHPEWVRSLRYQCQSAGVPFFLKQWGCQFVDTHSGHFQHVNVAIVDGVSMIAPLTARMVKA